MHYHLRLKGAERYREPAWSLNQNVAVAADGISPINFQTFELIWNTVDPIRSGQTNSAGVVTFDAVVQDDYVVLALFGGIVT